MIINLVRLFSELKAGSVLPDGYKLQLSHDILPFIPTNLERMQDFEIYKIQNYCNKLGNILWSKENENLDLVIHFDWAASQPGKVFIRLQGQLLNKLLHICGNESKLSVSGEFAYSIFPGEYGNSNFSTGDMEIVLADTSIKAAQSEKKQSNTKQSQGQSSIASSIVAFCEDKDARLSDNDIRTNFINFIYVNINIYLSVEDEYLHAPHIDSAVLGAVCKDIQQNSVQKDVSIVAANGCHEVLKANKCFLTAHSPVLKALLEGPFEEANQNEIQMEFSAECVKSLLDYVYTTDFPEAVKSSKLAVELLQAANYYQMQTLEEKLAKMFLLRHNAWFDVNAAVELFRTAAKIEISYNVDLKNKAIQVLKSKGTPENFTNLKPLFGEDWDTVVEICELNLQK